VATRRHGRRRRSRKAHIQIRKDLVALEDNKKEKKLSGAVNIPVVANKMTSTLLHNFYDMDKYKNVEMPRCSSRH